MKPADQLAKSASVPKTGLFAMLRGLLRGEGSGAPASVTSAGRGSVIARRPALAVLTCVSALACMLVAGAAPAAAATEFGEEGEHSGQFRFPYGVAVDQASGGVYVGDRNNYRIDKFTGSGGFMLAWGWGVNEESPAEELQTCTTSCQAGKTGTGVGEYATESTRGMAVDQGTGDVYVVDWENWRVEKFGPSGDFILMLGGGVDQGPHHPGNICTAAYVAEGDTCGAGTPGTGSGEFEWSYQGSYIAIGPGGDVYVGDKARVQIFAPLGAYKEEISLAGLSSTEQVSALAVDTSGDVFLVDGFVGGGVREFAFNKTTLKWEEKSTKFDESSFAIGAIALDKAGDLYVGDSEGGFHVLKYDPTGKELASFGANTVAESHGIAFADTSGALYVAGATIEREGHFSQPRVFVLTPPPPGPLIAPGSETGKPGLHGEATLEATINPEGHATTYHFEYLTETQFKEDGGTFGAGTVATTAAALSGSEFEEEHAEAKLPEAALVPGETYRWRVIATDSLNHTATSAPQTLEETPSALVDGPWASEVTSSTVTLAARINPQGASTSYRLEYGTSTAYGRTLAGNVGAGSEPVAVSYHVQELAPGTTYHYRLVTVNECIAGRPPCTQEGADHTFTTLPGTTATAGLPDGRAWELVTPANAGGASFELFGQVVRKAASAGGAITYGAKGAPLGEGVETNYSIDPAQVLSRRSSRGWESRDISPPIGPTPEGIYYPGSVTENSFYSVFSSDLASAVLRAKPFTGTLTPDALPGTFYLRNNATCAVGSASCFTALLTPANTPPGTKLEIATTSGQGGSLEAQIFVLAGTPDLGHIVFSSQLRLTEDAVEYVPHGELLKQSVGGNFYEWSAGRLGLVTILPNGKADESDEASLAGERNEGGETQHPISTDGRRVAWTLGSADTKNTEEQPTFKALYVRDMVEEKTVRVGGQSARYQTMSSDGSRVFYLEKGDLYEYHVAPGTPYDAGTTTDLTAGHGAGEASAGVQESVSDVSEDGSSVYFVANGVLGDGAEHGAKPGGCEQNPAPGRTCSLYLLHDTGGTWEPPRFIATLSSEDENSWYSTSGVLGEPLLESVSSRVSPNGRYLAFMSSRSLTGYDNVDANPAAKGARDEEVFLYDSATGRVACASCDPSGARPHGVLSGGPTPLLVQTGGNPEWGAVGNPHWLAGNLPGWENPPGGTGDKAYQPRYLSDSGRMFFDSPEPLVAQDTNGLEDVYQYEPAGVGSCAAGSGCVSLISSGHSGSESAFMDASENGEDVFFLSSDHLTGADIDTGYDVWDAHVCSASSPCLAPPVSPPPCSSGDSCKPAPAQQPELFGPAPSATFSGAGNLTPAPPVAAKPLTRAQKLSKALTSCRKKYKKSRRRRAACERSAHKQFGAAKRATKSAHTNRRASR